jgi:hypothetical protein
MGRERCCKCQKMRSDVQLRSTDDRLYQVCFEKNEADLDAHRRHAAGGNAAATSGSTSRRGSTTTSSASKHQKQSSVACSPTLPSLKSDVVNAAAAGNVASVPMLAASTVNQIQSDNDDDLNDNIHKTSILKCIVKLRTHRYSNKVERSYRQAE